MGAQYRRIPILDAARRCGLLLNEGTLDREEVEAACPFCGDNEGKYHLYLNTSRDVYYCVLCGARGNSVSLYARLEGVTNRQAFLDLRGEAWLYRFPERPLPKGPREPEQAPLERRHMVYTAMLTHLELASRHRDALLERGLDEARIADNGYRTLPRSQTARQLLAGMLAGFHDLEGVPGFYVRGGRWTLAGRGGLLIPCRDRDGLIQGLQLRLDDTGQAGRKYRWLSSRGLERGTRGRTCIHVTGDIHARTAYLTEGALKGDVSSFLDHDALFLCLAGVNALSDLREVLAGLERVEEAVIALDMDKLTNWRIRRAVERIAQTIRSIPGLRVRTMDWNMSFKGVDDYYKARREAAARGVSLLDMTSNFISRYLEDLWRRKYPDQDRGFIRACEWEERIVPIAALKCAPVEDGKNTVPGQEEPEDAPLVCVNGTVIEGQERCRILRAAGRERVRIYQNKPWVMPAAA